MKPVSHIFKHRTTLLSWITRPSISFVCTCINASTCCRKTSNFGRILEKLIPNSRSFTAITSCRASKFDFFSCSLQCGYFFRSWMCFRVSYICSKILINSLTGTKCPRRLYHSPIYLHLIISDTTSERKARKLVCHSQFYERSSPAVKARAPTSSTTKLWSNH